MLRAKNWGDSTNTTLTLIKQFIRQLSNHNLQAEEVNFIRLILTKYELVRQQVENEEAA